MFRARQDAALQLADLLHDLPLHAPLVLGIPRGGVVIGATLARELDADHDVVLARKLRAPNQPELAIGAIAETGVAYLNHLGDRIASETPEYLAAEREYQLADIARRQRLYRRARPRAPIIGRSVIVTDDGIATGATMNAALHVVRAEQAREVIVAVPVGSPDRLAEIRHSCDRLICPLSPDNFYAIGEYYRDFSQVEDEEVLDLLRQFSPRRPAQQRPR